VAWALLIALFTTKWIFMPTQAKAEVNDPIQC
jgi:tellurite resistance protein TehA-like permease